MFTIKQKEYYFSQRASQGMQRCSSKFDVSCGDTKKIMIKVIFILILFDQIWFYVVSMWFLTKRLLSDLIEISLFDNLFEIFKQTILNFEMKSGFALCDTCCRFVLCDSN